MKSLLTTSLIIVAAIGLCAFAAWLMTLGHQTQSNNTEHNSAEEHQDDGNKEQSAGVNGDHIQGNSNYNEEGSEQMKRLDWVAKFSGILAIVAILQVWTFVQTQRAFIAPSQFQINAPPAPNNNWRVRIAFKNNGPSAARNAQIEVAIGLTRDSKPLSVNEIKELTHPPPKDTPSQEIIPPGKEDSVVMQVTEASWKLVTAKQNLLMLWGDVYYSDVFFLPHHLQFCYTYDVDDTLNVDAPQFAACPAHNRDSW